MLGAAATMTRLGVPHEPLDAEQMSERFPGLVPRRGGEDTVAALRGADTSADSGMYTSDTELVSESSSGAMTDGEASAEAADMGLFEPGGGSVNASAAVLTPRLPRMTTDRQMPDSPACVEQQSRHLKHVFFSRICNRPSWRCTHLRLWLSRRVPGSPLASGLSTSRVCTRSTRRAAWRRGPTHCPLMSSWCKLQAF